jgi:nucleoside phosphorylase
VRHLKAYKDVLDGGIVCVITTNDSERRAVLGSLDAHRKLEVHSAYPRRRAYLGTSNRRLLLVLDGDGAFAGAGSAARFACDYLADSALPSPAAVVLCGVCWGNPAVVGPRDVVVGTTVISVNRARSTIDKRRESLPESFRSTFPHGALEALKGENVVVGASLVSVEEQMMSTKARDEYLNLFPSVAAGEMEAFVVIPACDARKIPWLVIKGVSDFGDDNFERTLQAEVAAAAAAILKQAVALLVPAPDDDSPDPLAQKRLELIDVLHGRCFRVRSADLDWNSVKHSVDQVMRRLQVSIDYYTGCGSMGDELGLNLSRVVKEVALNAFTHGRATNVDISLDAAGISYQDDGRTFTTTGLGAAPGARGGAMTWNILERDYIIPKKIVVNPLPARGVWTNRLRIDVPNSTPGLIEARTHCRAVIDLAVARGTRSPGLLIFHPECLEIYVDLRGIEMLSIVLDISEEFQPLLGSGKKLIVALSDPDIESRLRADFPQEIATTRLVLLPGA